MIVITCVWIGATRLHRAAIRKEIDVPHRDGVSYLCVYDIDKQCVCCIKTLIDRIEWKVVGNGIQAYNNAHNKFRKLREKLEKSDIILLEVPVILVSFPDFTAAPALPTTWAYSKRELAFLFLK